jgi:hypothetical protein
MPALMERPSIRSEPEFPERYHDGTIEKTGEL